MVRPLYVLVQIFSVKENKIPLHIFMVVYVQAFRLGGNMSLLLTVLRPYLFDYNTDNYPKNHCS